ncbi:ubiquitin carboxyl-terminal hydrolase [Parendozoicomonas haliclonae]|uniref:Ubiquitin carboxyl-terminal hydrolase n=1 Tax=Parendozoicomonas haliclonae TaxID=1960125 RepID=A0A1X7ALD8_9GAMM|nr:ubiquitin carboxyl-terminal hydrolase family protein [Parendozoicomonas haliclonae]SMA48367.1 Ubiquitin carboxyl-terminal hydrolase [Parendozoicomonas haliclonae]
MPVTEIKKWHFSLALSAMLTLLLAISALYPSPAKARLVKQFNDQAVRGSSDSAPGTEAHTSSALSPQSYREGLSGSWLMTGYKSGLLFDNRHLNRQTVLVSLAALSAAAVAKLPTTLGYTGAFPTLTGRLAAFALPGWLFWQHWNNNEQWQSNRIAIVDNPTLANRVSIEVRREYQTQQLIFRLPPVTLTGLDNETLTTNSPLSHFIQTLDRQGSDFLSIYWHEQQQALQITAGHGSGITNIITLPALTDNLASVDARFFPPILSLLQPAGLNLISSLLQCLTTQQGGRQLCANGALQLESRSGSTRYYRYQSEDNIELRPVTGKVLGKRYLVPLPPCRDKLLCPMTLTWNISALNLPAADYMPPAYEPLLLYTEPERLLDIPKRVAPVQPLMMQTVQPWQTDLLSLAPYTAAYLLTDLLLSKGLGYYGVASASVLTGGLGAWGLGNAVAETSHSSRPFRLWPFSGSGGYGGSGGGGSGGGGDDDYGRHSKESSDYMSATLLEQHLVHALEASGGAKAPASDVYVEEQTGEPTLTHMGNNCFFNSTLTYLAHTLQPEELNAIEHDRYLSETLFERLMDDADAKEAYEDLKEAFLGLMRSMKLESFSALTKAQRDKLQRDLYDAIKAFINTTPGEYGVLESILAPKRMNRLSQEDAQEFMSELLDIFQLQRNTAGSVVIADEKEVHIDGQVGSKIHVDKRNQFHVLPVDLPNERDIKAQKINDVNALLNKHFLKKEWVGERSERLHINAADAAVMGLKGVSNVKVPFYKRQFLANERAGKLQHLSIQFKMFNYGEYGRKIRTFTRRLFKGNGAITVPVSNLSATHTNTVTMEPDAMVLHQGSTLYGGHYITAVRSGREWIIYDDTQTYATRLSSSARFWSHSPMEVLRSYIEAQELDPYIIHYRH